MRSLSKIFLNFNPWQDGSKSSQQVGNLFSSIIASTNTGTTRAIPYQFVSDHGIEDNVVSFATDSIITTKKIESDSDKKRFWLSELKSLNDGTFCDSIAMPIDIVGKLVSKEEVEFYDDEKYEPESEL